jgi:hypothetical protein
MAMAIPRLFVAAAMGIVACFPHAGTVEARSLETDTQQKKNECL